MKILSMTATFGKLDNQTLTFEPGLQVIHAPNEWGKSTWCAFMVAMLYGIETSQRSSSKGLADKERFAPWSGKPMSGRMDIEWNGRCITLERTTRGRTPFGQFRAYETESGLPTPELTGDNCGQTLLGVEKQVFVRSAFIRQSELPVTQDETLRRRLNALVTTGDESGASDALAQKLKDLKNKCRHNKTGKLPEAEKQRDSLTSKLRELSELDAQCRQIAGQQEQQKTMQAQLENHLAALAYNENRVYAEKLTDAKTAQAVAQARVQELESRCNRLPDSDTLSATLSRAEALRTAQETAHSQARLVPPAPAMPEVPRPFQGLDPNAALAQAETDSAAWSAGSGKGLPWLGILGIAAAVLGILLLCLSKWVHLAIGVVVLVLGAAALFAAIMKKNSRSAAMQALQSKYAPLSPELWVSAAKANILAQADYETRQQAYLTQLQSLNARIESINSEIAALTGGESLARFVQTQQAALDSRKTLDASQRELQRATALVQALDGTRQDAPPPRFPDDLPFSEADTRQRLARCIADQTNLERQLGICHGRMTALGQPEVLQQELDGVNRRIEALEQTYAALTLAQDTLAQAAGELQRRFAPRISARAKELFGKLTGDRYDRLILGEDLSLSVGAQGEDTLHDTQWRSDGTVDQLYLALRLAVAAELTPEAPLILDDAFVRFDDIRMAAAMALLKEEAAGKQVILFSCQNRESNLL